MARLPRLVLPGHAHLVVQRVLDGCAPFGDEADRQLCLQALRDSVADQTVRLHGFALRDDELQLVLTPTEPGALAQVMQALGRRHVGAYNRRHGRAGTLWQGRFGSAVLEPGAAVLQALLLVDGAGDEPSRSSAAHHSGHRREPWLHDPAEIWQLGNTPFDRELAWQQQLQRGLADSVASALRSAARGGWAIGSPAFLAALATTTSRPLQPRARGRPRRPKAADAPGR